MEDQSGRTQSGAILGTPSYMAPEQAAGQAREVGPAADTYALGAILYEMLTGRPPFRAASMLDTLEQVRHQEPVPPGRLQPNLPRDLETICLKCLHKEPAKRYARAADLATDLGRFLNGEPIRARRVGGLERAWKWTRRNPLPAGSIAACALALVLGTAFSLYFAFEAQSKEKEAIADRDNAKKAEAKANRQLALAHFNRGLTLCEQGEVNRGLHWLLESLKTSPAEDADFRRMVRSSLAAWLEAAPALRHIIRHQGLWRAACSSDGRFLATTGRDKTVRIWDLETGAQVRTLLRSEDLGGVSFSPDGKTIVAGGYGKAGKNQGVYVWEAATGNLRGTLEVSGRARAVLFTPDGQKIVTGTWTDRWRGEVQTWDARTLQPSGPPLLLPGNVSNLYFSSDGRICVTATDGGAGGGYQLVDLMSRSIGKTWSAGNLSEGLLIPGSRTFLYHQADFGNQPLRWRDVISGTERQFTPRNTGAGSTALRSVTPDGRTCWFGTPVGRVYGRDADTGRLLSSFMSHEGHSNPQAVSGDGKHLVVLSRNSTAHVWEIPRAFAANADADGPDVGRISDPSADFELLAFSPDRSRCVLGGWKGLARLVDTASGRSLGPPLRHPWDNVRCVAFSPDGKIVATGAHPSGAVAGAVWLWDARTGQPLRSLPLTNWPSALAFSTDGKLLATGDFHQAVRIWDVATGKAIGAPMIDTDVILSVAFSPDGKTLAAGTADDRKGPAHVSLWDLTSRKQIGLPLPTSFRVGRLTFSPNGRTLLSVCLDGRVFRWDTAGGKLLGELPPPLLGSFTSSYFGEGIPVSPDGRTFLTGNRDGLARLWDVARGEPLRGATFSHQAAVNAGAFSPDGTLVVIGCADGSVRLWDLATFKPVGPAVRLRRPILGVSFTPDGRLFMAIDKSGRCHRWPVPVPVDDDTDRLASRLQVRTGLQMDTGQDGALLGHDDWEARRRELVRLEGSANGAGRFATSEADWHDACAADAEEEGRAFAALWHLDRLISLRPGDWLSHVRKAHLYVTRESEAAKSLDVHLAAAEYERAKQLAGAEQLLNGYRQRAADCQLTKQFAAALWYLDRLEQAMPRDWTVYRDRAGMLAQLGKKKESETALARAVELGADAPVVLRQAQVLARQGKWDRTAALLGRLHDEQPEALNLVHLHAIALLQAGDAAAYRRSCADLLRATSKAKLSPFAANAVAWTCAVGPQAVQDFGAVVALAEQAVAQAPAPAKALVLNTLGATLYRAGRCQDAVAKLNESVAANGGAGVMQDWLFLAMAHHRLGEAMLAKKWLDKAASAPPTPGDEHFWDNAEVDGLRREVRALLEKKEGSL